MIDFSIVQDHFVLVVILACLIVGYILKHASFFKKLPNDDIPIILTVFGGILNLAVSGLSIESIVYGAVMGLASTGFHQAFKNFIERTNETDGGEK